MTTKNQLKIGSHMQIRNNSLTNLVNDAIDLTANAVQIFLRSPMFSRAKTRNLSGFTEARKVMKEKNILLCTHAQYVFNYTRDNPPNASSILEDLEFNDKIGGLGTVVHLGSGEFDAAKIAKNVISTVHEAQMRGLKSKFIIENQARVGKKVCTTIDQLADIMNFILITDPSAAKGIGFCIDTCHLVVNETYPVSGILSALKQFDAKIGVKYLSLIHFNDADSLTADRHADLFTGYIGNEKLNGNPKNLIDVAKWAANNNVPLIIERGNDLPMQIRNQIETVRSAVTS